MAQDIDRYSQTQSCLHFINQAIGAIQDPVLKTMCENVLKIEKFVSSPGSATPKHHHCYKGGLVVHTSEVLENAILMSKAESYNVNLDIIIGSIVWHDFGKMFDYTEEKDENGDYKKYPHYKLIKHLSRSYAEFMISAEEHGLDDNLREQIGHVILSHHGRQDWGSPVEPVTPEAFIVHVSDWASAYASKDYYVRS